MKKIGEKKKLEVKQVNFSKSQVSETIIEIRLSFSCCYIHVDVNRRKQRGEEYIIEKPFWKTFLSSSWLLTKATHTVSIFISERVKHDMSCVVTYSSNNNNYNNPHHDHHHIVPLARISLTLSRHFSLSFIASGRSSGLHPVSSHSC